MQADGRLVAAGKLASPRYKGLWDGLRTVVKQEGLLGLWRGSTPAVQRAALVNLGVSVFAKLLPLPPLSSPPFSLLVCIAKNVRCFLLPYQQLGKSCTCTRIALKYLGY